MGDRGAFRLSVKHLGTKYWNTNQEFQIHLIIKCNGHYKYTVGKLTLVGDTAVSVEIFFFFKSISLFDQHFIHSPISLSLNKYDIMKYFPVLHDVFLL